MKPSLCLWLATLLLAASPAAPAQTACSSDGQPASTALLERFINADCIACWAHPHTVLPGPQAIALDWIVPGTLGDDAPLSAAARTEGLERMQTRAPAGDSSAAPQAAPALRVARGPVLGGYVGVSIALQPGSTAAGPWTAWLVLVESIPAGSDGTPVARNLVRNALELNWGSHGDQREIRTMTVAEGAQAARLQVVGWLEDARAHVVTAVQSQCAPDSE